MDLRTSTVFLTIFGQCINVLNYNNDCKTMYGKYFLSYKSLSELLSPLVGVENNRSQRGLKTTL